MGEINVPEHNWMACPSVPTANTAPALLKVLVVSGKPFVIACTKTGDELTTRAKASSELSLFFFGVPSVTLRQPDDLHQMLCHHSTALYHVS